jgi:hypothetical protein
MNIQIGRQYLEEVHHLSQINVSSKISFIKNTHAVRTHMGCLNENKRFVIDQKIPKQHAAVLTSRDTGVTEFIG